tara:strand:+ start:534 stop:740 length:207 start_codon:yes stop_codon:yes gene_type:complete
MEKEKLKTIQVRLDLDLHKKLKSGAALSGERLPDFASYIIRLGIWQQEQDREEEALKMQIQQRNECSK